MRIATSSLDLRRPATLESALQALRDDARTPIAGATDLYVTLNFGTLEARRFLDLSRLAELRGITERGDTLVIGALASFTALQRSPLVVKRLPMLVEAARLVGGVQIQNRATLGGNIANASPAGDSLPVLAAVDAAIVLRSVDGERRVPMTEFYTGYRASVMRPDELITAVEVLRVEGHQWFRKVGTRAALAISKVVVAGVRDGPRAARFAIGSVAPTVVRARKAEGVLAKGGKLEEAVRALQAEITPIDDLRSTAEYRTAVAGNLLRRFWAETA